MKRLGGSARQVRQTLTAWSFILPALIGLGIFVYGSLVYSLYISFTSWDLLTPARWIGFANYARAFRDESFIQCLYNTVYFVVAIVPLGIVFAMAMAMALNKQLPGIGFFRAAYYMPSITSTIAIGMVWLWIFNPDQGVLNAILKLVGVSNLPRWLESRVWAKPALGIMRLWQVSGYYMIMYLSGLQNIPNELWHFQLRYPVVSLFLFLSFLYRQNLHKIAVGTRNDMHTYQLPKTLRCLSSGFGGSLNCTYIASYHNRDVTASDLLVAYQRYVGGFDHGVSSFD
jgi:hypothetical protein